MNTFDKF